MKLARTAIEEPLTVLAELKHQGLIGHLGLSNVTWTNSRSEESPKQA